MTSCTEYARQNRPTVPSFSVGSACFPGCRFAFACSPGAIGRAAQSCQPGCAARNASGSSHSPSYRRQIYSPSAETVGQNMSWFTSKEQGSTVSIPSSSSAKQRAMALYSSGFTSRVSGIRVRARGDSGRWLWVVYTMEKCRCLRSYSSKKPGRSLSLSKVSIERPSTSAFLRREPFSVPARKPPLSLIRSFSPFGSRRYCSAVSGVRAGF